MTKHLTMVEVEERFEEAALVLRRLPDPPGSGPKSYGSSWPPYVHEVRHAYGYHDVPMRVVPSTSDIAAMEECLAWLALVAPADAKIVWQRAEGRRWREIGIQAGVVRQTAWRRWVAALQTIQARINSRKPGKKPPQRKKTVKSGQKTAKKQESLGL